jgi:site-specific DNA-methyltransferase (adenine-specific)/modification methylase
MIRCEVIGDARLYLGDCRDIMPTLGKFDLLLTDPPYGIGANKQTLGSGKKQFDRGGDWDDSRPSLLGFIDFAEKHCIWGGNYFTDELPPTNHWLIWHKKNDNLSFSEVEMAWTTYGKQSRHLSHHWGGEEKKHPTQKPLKVIEWCLGLVESQTVFDPFMGSGTTGVACANMGRQFTGIEREVKYFDIACKRIDDAYRQQRMFA